MRRRTRANKIDVEVEVVNATLTDGDFVSIKEPYSEAPTLSYPYQVSGNGYTIFGSITEARSYLPGAKVPFVKMIAHPADDDFTEDLNALPLQALFKPSNTLMHHHDFGVTPAQKLRFGRVSFFRDRVRTAHTRFEIVRLIPTPARPASVSRFLTQVLMNDYECQPNVSQIKVVAIVAYILLPLVAERVLANACSTFEGTGKNN